MLGSRNCPLPLISTFSGSCPVICFQWVNFQNFAGWITYQYWQQVFQGTFRQHLRASNQTTILHAWLNQNRTSGCLDLDWAVVWLQYYRKYRPFSVILYGRAKSGFLRYQQSIGTCDKSQSFKYVKQTINWSCHTGALYCFNYFKDMHLNCRIKRFWSELFA